MSVEQELIERVLECAAEDDPGLNETIYKNFYEAMPDAEQLMSHVDEGTRGKMIAEIYRLLLAEDVAASDGDYLMFETKTHANSYFVLPEMYNVLSDVFLQTLRLSAAREWSPTVEAAVSRRLNSLARAINSAVIKN
ncbi:MAG: hypothetical protein P8I59_12505 [Pseudomonadales bacterium]|jgi:hypothetical protein|nr:hypothetical protein [Pseudomonadales bacterium]|tara:strand:+ start:508 stop:918 length:411 start_codon:yes stop_codon:yes gene_type:complete